MPKRGKCPPDEKLAAFVDKRLEEVERNEILSHIDECKVCFEIVTETARFQLDKESMAGDQTATPAERPELDSVKLETAPSKPQGTGGPDWIRPGLIGLGIAAALLLVLIPLGVFDGAETPPENLSVAALSLPLSSTPVDVGRSFWATTGPPSFAGRSDAQRRAFRTGVLLIDLAVALQLEDALLADQLRSQAGRINPVLERDRLRSLEAITAAEQDLDAAEEFYFSLGKWAEAARLAAATQNTAFFAGPGGDASAWVFAQSGEAPLTDATQRHLTEVENLLTDALSEENLVRLETELSSLIALLW